ncbi:hypothetical protein DB30_02397 [Enhygromyxa salina]|uniref:VWFA domain-containing protein n=1 Tax=Enhygromyxa salina TaxID=215803 RepID=A0A0C2CQ35_9BACT|nr:vWA domain-containing protein [Enhygromyxa salina]KIG11845.1 hypothetical protein DB30_02397 [Enhygromyxa salina]
MSRLKLGTKFTLLAGCAMAMAMTTTSGCLNHPLKPVELEKGSEVEDQLQLTVNKDVDILFVIDNSGSMGEEQAILANNFGSFIQVLEADDVEANYRLGITTSDNGNPWCPPGSTTPEAGNLVLSSCKSRIGDFIFNSGETDVTDLACNDICTLDAAALEVLPSTTDYDTQAKPRKWLENIEGKKNIPDSTNTEDAFKCFGPQGINGCGFESQLESMYLALIRAQNADEVGSYGFLRASAILAVVFVTDEADCSYNKSFSEIFEQDGNRVFWSDPAAAFPTSAVCWNAGVDCEGDPNNYDTCSAVNKDVNGNSGVDNGQAVLHPMSRYIGLLDGLEKEKQELNAEQEVIVALIGGVANDGTAFYGDVSGTNPEFQNSFGIGPGCEAPNPLNPAEPVQAVPPVRLRDLVEEFTPGNMFSICQQDYSDAMEAIAQRIRDQIQPACYTKCVKDTDASTAIVDPECTVEEDPPGNDNTVRIQECERDAAGYVLDGNGDYSMPGSDVNVCYALLTDDSMQTGSVGDDMSDYCKDENFNLEFKIARRPGYPATGGTSISATCSLADFPDVTCPGIGG